MKREIPLDEGHTCPCCDGKGFVRIIEERVRKPQQGKRDIMGRLFPYEPPLDDGS